MAEKIQFTDDDLFVAFGMPGEEDFQVMLNDGGDDSRFTFVIHPFDKTGNSKKVELRSNKLLANQQFEFRSNRSNHVSATSKADYLKIATSLISEMQSTELEKVVLSRIHQTNADGIDLFTLFGNLGDTYPKAFIYLFNIPGEGTWMGATPEILMERNDDTITTVALAATQKANDRKAEDVVWNDKEIEEQAIIQRYIETHLHQANLDYKKGKTYTSQAGNVFHIKTIYEVPNLNSTDELIDQLHPGPAICGMPKTSAKERIINGESHDREYYCGYLGLKSKEKTSLFINLRCMQVFADQFALYVGGGLTKDSDAEMEWEETTTKSKTLESVIQKSYIYAHDVK